MPGFGQPAQMGNGASFPSMDMPMPPGMSEQQQAEFQVSTKGISPVQDQDGTYRSPTDCFGDELTSIKYTSSFRHRPLPTR